MSLLKCETESTQALRVIIVSGWYKMTKEKVFSESSINTIALIKEQIKKGNKTIFCILRSVSRSGMNRKIDFYMMSDNEPYYLNDLIVDVCDYRRDKQTWSVKVGGCGMDMGFSVVYGLSRRIFSDKKELEALKLPGRNGCKYEQTDGGYVLKHRWL